MLNWLAEARICLDNMKRGKIAAGNQPLGDCYTIREANLHAHVW